jgi:hypothetical protein
MSDGLRGLRPKKYREISLQNKARMRIHERMIKHEKTPSDAAEIEREILELAAHLDAAEHRFLTLVRRFDDSGRWQGAGVRSCAHWLAWKCGLTTATARERVRVARALGSLQRIDEALSKGLISYSKVRALTRVARADNEQRLLNVAKAATAAQLERICRGLSSAEREGRPVSEGERWVVQRQGTGGLVRIEAQLLPDEAALVMQAIDAIRTKAQRAQMAPAAESSKDASAETSSPEPVPPESAVPITLPPRFGRADALVKAADLLLSGGADPDRADEPKRTGGDRVTVLVHLKENDLVGRSVVELEDGTRVSAETLRRMACDAGIVPVVLDDDSGNPLDIGRRTRAIPPAIRRALVVRDRACAFPGCDCTKWLDAHHVEHWLDGGETKLDNLILLCPFHHRLIHEGGFTVALEADQRPQFFDPSGRLVALAPRMPLVPDRALRDVRAANENAGAVIDDRTCRSEWRGERLDLDYVVGVLM